MGSHRLVVDQRMKSLEAHTETSHSLCLENCCISLNNLTSITDTVSRILMQIAHSRCPLSQKLINKVETLRNLSINSTGRFLATINYIKNNKSNMDPDSYINTICNLANDIVELRNVVRELLEEPSMKNCNSISNNLEELRTMINVVGALFSTLALATIARINNITMSSSGKIASSLASLIFAFLLDIHVGKVRETLASCYSTNIYVK